MLCRHGRPLPHHVHDQVPRQSVAPGQLLDGEVLRVPDQLAGQTAGELAFDLGVVFGVALPAIGTLEGPLQPDEGGGTTEGMSRTSTRRVSWTLEVLWPQAGQRTTLRVSATSMTSLSISSSTTRTTFHWT